MTADWELAGLWERLDAADPWAALGAWLDEHADAEDRAAVHSWPLVWCKMHGLRMGLQWAGLGYLAARYARDFTTDQLAAELWAVVEAGDQDVTQPWRWREIYSCAERAVTFIDGEDERERLMVSRARQWAGLGALVPVQRDGTPPLVAARQRAYRAGRRSR